VTAVAVLTGLCLLLALPLAVTAVRQRALAAMALRNVGRRRTEAALVIGGALLGTAIITSAFVVGDVIDGAVADEARTSYGPIDLTVTTADRDTFDVATALVRDAVRDGGLAASGTTDLGTTDLGTTDRGGVDGLLDVTVATATLEAPARDTALPRVEVVALDLAEARTFGGEAPDTGLASVGDLAPGEVLVSSVTAERLHLDTGDRLLVHVADTTTELTVAEVVDQVGLAGYGGAIVAPGTLPDATGAADGPAPVRHQLLVSLDGGVFDTREAAGDAADTLRTALAELPDVRVDAPKAAVLDVADQEGAGFTELFGTIGAFSVLAGILLLVNLFTMLAEERRTELGMLRALGFTRRRLTRTFALEGVLYALPAAVLGAGLGVGIGWLVAVVAGPLLGVAADGARYPLVVEPGSLAAGAALGLLVSLVTVWLASTRIARLNIVRAIRDLPEPSRRRARRRTLVLSVLTVAAGVALTVAGAIGEAGPALLLGVPLAAYAATPWLRRLVGERRVRLAVGVVVLGWALGVVPLFPDVVAFDDPVVFVLQGVVSTAGAVSLIGGLDRVWAGLIARFGRGGGGLAARLGVAYPLARPTRTSLLLGMFALVVFTVTILSTVSGTFDRNSDTMATDVAVGADVLLDTATGGGVDAAALTARDDIAGVAEVTRGVATFTADHLDAARAWTVTGFDAALLDRGVPAALASRDPAYASDAAAYQATLDDPTLAVVPDDFLAGVGATAVGVGSTIAALDPATGAPHELTVVGVSGNDWLGTGVLVGQPLAAELTAGAETGVRSYVEVAVQADPAAVAASLNRTYLAAGADATPIPTLVGETMGQLRGLMAMLQGYLGLGLLIGTAGLGVVMVRAVRERRQGIAMLRAMGASSRLVRRAMLVEAGLIVVQGTVIGVLLGLATSRQMLGLLDQDLTLTVPWVGLAVIVAVPLVASLAATAWPAARAAAIRPAVALRTAE
jgi:putative ABC transport system permease protein